MPVHPWSRGGQHRLYVTGQDGVKLGYVDTDDLTVHAEPGCEQKLRHLLNRFVADSVGTDHAEPDWTDLAAREPGHSIMGLDGSNFRTGVDGERRTAGVLTPLLYRGWKILHSVPIADHRDLDHVLIGPGGVWVINTKTTTHKVTPSAVDGKITLSGNNWPWLAGARDDAAAVTRIMRNRIDPQLPAARPLIAVWTDVEWDPFSILIPAGSAVAAIEKTPHPEGQLTDRTVDVVFAMLRRSTTWEQD